MNTFHFVKKHPHFFSITVILIVCWLGYGDLLERGVTPYSNHSDLVSQNIASKTLLYDSWKSGHGIPFWRSDQLSGSTVFTSLITLYAYPLNFLFFLLPPAAAFGPTIWIHFAICGVAYYMLGCVAGLSYMGRLFMAFVGMFSFKLIIVAYAGWLPVIPSLSFLPLFFAVVMQMFKKPGVKWSLILAALIVICIPTQVQILYYLSLFIFLYVLLMSVKLYRESKTAQLKKAIQWLAAGVVTGIGLSSFYLFPTLSELDLLIRSNPGYLYFLSGHSLKPTHLLTFLCPEILGSPLDNSYMNEELWEEVAYFGIVPLLCAIYAAVFLCKRRLVLFLASGFIFSVVLSADTVLLKAAYNAIPGFNLFRNPTRLLFISAFLGTLLAGIGFNELYFMLKRQKKGLRLSNIFALLLILFVCIEGGYYGHRYLMMEESDKVYKKLPFLDQLDQDRNLYRVAPLSRLPLTYSHAAINGLQIITGYDAFSYRHYRTFFNHLTGMKLSEKSLLSPWFDIISIDRWDLLDILCVKYLLVPVPMPDEYELLRFIDLWKNQKTFMLYEGWQTTDVYVYENLAAKSFVFPVKEVVGVSNGLEMEEEVRRNNLRKNGVVLDHRDFSFPKWGENEHFSFDLKEKNKISIESRFDTKRFLVISQVWHPGWQATVDGEPLRLYQTNIALLGAMIPAGNHRTELFFRQPLLRTGLVVSGVSLFVWLLLCVKMIRIKPNPV